MKFFKSNKENKKIKRSPGMNNIAGVLKAGGQAPPGKNETKKVRNYETARKAPSL